MLDAEKIKFYFRIFKGLTIQDMELFYQNTNQRELAANQIYIHEGSNQKTVAYIKKGLIRSFSIQENGEEITNQLLWEDNFIASPDVILFNRTSRFTIQAIEKTVLLEINYDSLQHIINENLKYEQVRIHFLHKIIKNSIDELNSFKLLNAEERYLKFIHDKPDINNRVPNKYIANVLGITPVSLSRIRKRLAEKNNR
ncbi:MAG: Crp/Fnr family transcriptional regulator [Chitinophagales bacterium]